MKIYCHASDYGIRVILIHVWEGGVEKLIAYVSRTLSIAESKYSQMIWNEGLAVIPIWFIAFSSVLV